MLRQCGKCGLNLLRGGSAFSGDRYTVEVCNETTVHSVRSLDDLPFL